MRWGRILTVQRHLAPHDEVNTVRSQSSYPSLTFDLAPVFASYALTLHWSQATCPVLQDKYTVIFKRPRRLFKTTYPPRLLQLSGILSLPVS